MNEDHIAHNILKALHNAGYLNVHISKMYLLIPEVSKIIKDNKGVNNYDETLSMEENKIISGKNE